MTTPYYTDERAVLHHGDCLDVLAAMPDASVDAIVTDPPYSLTDRREQYCAGDVLRDAIVTDAQHGDAERAKSLVTLRITVAPALAVRVRGVDLDGDVAAGEEEVDNDGAPGRQDDDMLMNEGHAVAGEERLSGTFRLWVRKGSARCIGACRCLGQHGDGLIRVPVRLRNDSLGESERTPGIVALGGAELAAVLALDVARGTGELLPASGADTLDQPFELLCPEFVGAGAGARRLASVAEPSGVGGVGGPADRALSFDLVAHRAVLSWRPTVLRGFMSSLWDGTGVETDTRLWRECLRVLKPGGHCLAFGSPRTWHNLQTSIEKSGFEVRDSIAWLYSQGFPKSLDVSKAIDKAAGAEREVVGLHAAPARTLGNGRTMDGGAAQDAVNLTAPATPDAVRWSGWGTALKPGHEPVVWGVKPVTACGMLSVIGSHLDRLEEACRPSASDAGPSSAHTRADSPEARTAIAPARAATRHEAAPARTTPTGAAGVSSEATATSVSEWTVETFWSTVTSWRKCWAELCEATSTSTTSTATSRTTDLQTLSSCLSQITQSVTATSTSEPDSLRSLVTAADNLFAAGVLNSRSILALSAIESATASTPRASQDAGGGSPAFEPVVVARKPLAGTVAANVLTHGTGALNIDGCRVGLGDERPPTGSGVSLRATSTVSPYRGGDGPNVTPTAGRWPANVILDESQAAALDEQSGMSESRVGKPRGAASGDGWGMTATGAEYADSGGASRFFYTSKAASAERPKADGIAHATVKPLDLMRWLVRLVTPPGGVVLDPFAGSGTTLEAAIVEGFRCIGIEREADYLPLIDQRIARACPPLDFTEETA